MRCWQIPIFDPQQSRWLDRWDFIVLFVLLEVTFATPYELAYLDVQRDLTFYVNRVIDSIFCTDMVLRFFVAIPDTNKRGCWIKDPKIIAKSYLTSWFLVDLASLFPVDILYVAADNLNGGAPNSNLKVLRLARTVRLVRVTQGLRLLQRWRASIGLRNWLVSIVALLYSLLVVCHWAACLWGGISFKEYKDNHSSVNWLAAVRNAKSGPDDLYEKDINVYFMALYWAVMTITGIGYGDINPQNATEYKVALCCMSVMAGSWAVVIAEVCAITSTFSLHEVNFKRTMDDLNWLLSDWDVDHGTRRRLRTYFMESKDLQRNLMQKTILEQMSPKLQGEVLNGLHRPWTGRVRFLRAITDEALVGLVQRLRAQLFAPDELIPGSRTLFIVRRGVAVLLGKVMVSGTSWGEDMVLHNSFLRKRESARALCFLEVNALSYVELMQVAEAHPSLSKRIKAAAKIIGVHRSIVLFSRVVKQLRFHSLLDQDLSHGQVVRLVEASLAGEIDGDLQTNPLQEIRVRMLLREAAEVDRDLASHEQGSEGGDSVDGETTSRSPKDRDSAMLIQTLRNEAEELLAAYASRVESALGIRRRANSNGMNSPIRSPSIFSSGMSPREGKVSGLRQSSGHHFKGIQ